MRSGCAARGVVTAGTGTALNTRGECSVGCRFSVLTCPCNFAPHFRVRAMVHEHVFTGVTSLHMFCTIPCNGVQSNTHCTKSNRRSAASKQKATYQTFISDQLSGRSSGRPLCMPCAPQVCAAAMNADQRRALTAQAHRSLRILIKDGNKLGYLSP